MSESPIEVSDSPERQESPSVSPTNINEDHVCTFCSNKLREPRLLSCLHIFCTPCLEKLLSGEDVDDEDGEASVKPLDANNSITCPTCKQVTTLSCPDVNELVLDFVMCNMLDMSAIEDMQIVCTSCKAKERAVARCSDCANYLCPNCVTAHQYMRCFENHKVVSFEDIQAGGDAIAIHKPLFCPVHTAESMKYFCLTCQVPICTECMVSEHKGHRYERITDVDLKQVDELQTLVSECKGKVKVCEDATTSLENSLSELQMQRDNAKGLIQETFHSYKAILEKRRDTLLQNLDEIHSKQELNVMELSHGIEKTIEKIEDGCKLTERVLNNGNSLEILSLKKMLVGQLQFLINNTPKPDINVDIDFLTDADTFEKAVEETFGHFPSEEPQPVEAQGMSLHNSLEVESFSLPPTVLGPDSPLLLQQPLPPLPPLATAMAPPGTMGGVATSMGAIVPERSMSRGSQSPAMSDSGISVDASSSGSGANTPMANLATLMKLGAVNINGQGQITLNGQPLAGLNVNNVTGLTPSLMSQAQSLGHAIRAPSAQPDTSLNLSSLSSGPNSRSQTPSMDSMSNVFGHPSPTGSSSSFGMPPGGVPIGGSQYNNPHPPFPVRGSGKMTPMQIRCKFGQLGPGKGQFNSPHGFCLGMEEDIIVADTNNHRIQCFEKTGEFKYQFGIPGREEGQLWHPRKVAVMRSSGKYVVCDRGNERSRMQIFTKNGHFIKKIAIRYIDIVAGLAITQHGHIVAVDSVSPTVFCIAESGDLLKWFDCSDYMREPSDIAVSGKEYFVCDFKGHCVVVFNEDGQFIRRIGCENITNFPNGIDISDAGDVLVGDSHGNRFHVAVFQRDGSLIGEFECPYVKVSRCCGLKITSEGYVVTLAKNNHHVLVLNTLYIA